MNPNKLKGYLVSLDGTIQPTTFDVIMADLADQMNKEQIGQVVIDASSDNSIVDITVHSAYNLPIIQYSFCSIDDMEPAK